MDLVAEREIAIVKVDCGSQDSCSTCFRSRSDGSSLMLECHEWCCDVDIDEVCSKHRPKNEV